MRRLRLAVILGSLAAFGPLSIDMYLPALPHLQRDLGASTSVAQLTLTSCLAGLALGQLAAGPLSDRLGRRRPLLLGLAVYVAATLLCAAAPSIWALVGLRFAQGLAGSAGLVIGRAIVRDLHSGAAAARYFSVLMLVTGAAPILAPILGAQVLRVTSWRGIFVVLAVVTALVLAATALGLPETLPPERRHGTFASVLATFGRLLADRRFLAHVLVLTFSFGALFSYISGSPFVLENVYGTSPQAYSLVFALNGTGIVVASQTNRALLRRVPVGRLLVAGACYQAVGGLALALSTAAGWGLAGIVPGLFLVVSGLGFAIPNATALALGRHADVAGTASALLGVCQFGIGAAAAPLVGVAGSRSEVPMVAAIALLTVAAVLVAGALRRRPGAAAARAY